MIVDITQDEIQIIRKGILALIATHSIENRQNRNDKDVNGWCIADYESAYKEFNDILVLFDKLWGNSIV